MKNTAEIDPFQTTDPWKDGVDTKKSQDKPVKEQDNTEGSQITRIPNEQDTDKRRQAPAKNRFISGFIANPEARLSPFVRQEERTQEPIEIKDESQSQRKLKKKHQIHSG